MARRQFGLRVQEEESDEFDILWSDAGIPAERLQKLKPYQRMNHFPGMYILARKNNLAKNLSKF